MVCSPPFKALDGDDRLAEAGGNGGREDSGREEALIGFQLPFFPTLGLRCRACVVPDNAPVLAFNEPVEPQAGLPSSEWKPEQACSLGSLNLVCARGAG